MDTIIYVYQYWKNEKRMNEKNVFLSINTINKFICLEYFILFTSLRLLVEMFLFFFPNLFKIIYNLYYQ